jgi:hypothetical protein
MCTYMTAQQRGISDRQIYIHTDCTFHGHVFEKFLYAWSAAYFIADFI